LTNADHDAENDPVGDSAHSLGDEREALRPWLAAVFKNAVMEAMRIGFEIEEIGDAYRKALGDCVKEKYGPAEVR